MNAQELRALKREAHALKPVVRIGSKGLTDAVCAEVEVALDAHSLIKVKLPQLPEEREGVLDRLLEKTGAIMVAEIGHVAILYRKKADEKP